MTSSPVPSAAGDPAGASDTALQSRTVPVDGLAVHHLEGGPPSARAVVLLHGLVVSGRYMVPMAMALRRQARVLVPDLPGFGRSAGPRRVLDVAGLAAHLDAWIDAVGLSAPILLAHSFGCQVTAELAARSPRRLAGVLLVAPTIDPGAHHLRSQAWRLTTDLLHEPPSLWRIIVGDYFRAGARRSMLTVRAAFRHRIAERLPAIDVPALVVRGARDPICPQHWAEQAASLLPRGRLAVVPGAAHAVNYTAPEQLARLVLEVMGRGGA